MVVNKASNPAVKKWGLQNTQLTDHKCDHDQKMWYQNQLHFCIPMVASDDSTSVTTNEINDIMSSSPISKQQLLHFSINEHVQFSTSNTRFGASENPKLNTVLLQSRNADWYVRHFHTSDQRKVITYVIHTSALPEIYAQAWRPQVQGHLFIFRQSKSACGMVHSRDEEVYGGEPWRNFN